MVLRSRNYVSRPGVAGWRRVLLNAHGGSQVQTSPELKGDAIAVARLASFAPHVPPAVVVACGRRHHEDEWFYAIQGDYVVEVGSDRVHLAPGVSVLAPRRDPACLGLRRECSRQAADRLRASQQDGGVLPPATANR
jgi:uncharacterized cupin superfamily protein